MRALVLTLALSGCVGAAPQATGPVAPIRFDASGIEVEGTGQRIDFGRDRAGVVETMTRLQGSAPRQLPCDNGTIAGYRWQDGPLLVFRNDAFVGWVTSDNERTFDGLGQYGVLCEPLAIN